MLYLFGDLILASDALCSQLPTAAGGRPECSFRIAPPTQTCPDADRWDHRWRSPRGEVSLTCARDGDTYRLGMPGLATFRIENGGRSITCLPDGDLPAETLEHLLIDQVLPRVLAHRGRLVLHAASVATPAGAIAFLGDSGTGKSTLCAALARAGYPLLGDDGIVVRENAAGVLEAIATYPGLRLMPEPLAYLFDAEARGAPVAHHTAKRRLDGGGSSIDLIEGPSPVRAFYLLDEGRDIEISPLGGQEAFLTLVRSSFQMHLDDAGRTHDLFEVIGALADAVPMRRLSYPRELNRLPAVRRAVIADASALSPSSSAGCACS